jgi:uncharacterized protein with WD repeat
MMLGVGKKLVGGSRDDRASLLLASFHDATLRVDPTRDPVRIAMYVRQETRRGVFRELRKELDWERVGFGEDADQCSDAVSFEPPPCLKSASSESLPGRANGALMTTHCRGALWILVRKRHASLSPKEQAKIYRRLQKRRRRRFEGRQAALHADRDSGVRVVGQAAREAQS